MRNILILLRNQKRNYINERDLIINGRETWLFRHNYFTGFERKGRKVSNQRSYGKGRIARSPQVQLHPERDCANFAHKKQKLWKNLGSYFNGKISQISIGKPKDIYLSPFKIITKDVVNEIIKFENLFPYIDGLIFQVTGNITQIDIEHHSREKGKSNYNLIKSIKVFLRMLFGFSTMPLNISTYSGFTCAFLGFVLGIIYLIQYFQGKADVKGWTTLVILLLFLGGLILVSLGIIGKYLGQIYLTVNRQPKFIIKEVINEK